MMHMYLHTRDFTTGARTCGAIAVPLSVYTFLQCPNRPSISLVLKALKHQWRTRKASVQVTVLAVRAVCYLQACVCVTCTATQNQVLDFCMTNVKRSFSARFAGAELWRDIKDATKFKNVRPSPHTCTLRSACFWLRLAVVVMCVLYNYSDVHTVQLL